MKGESSNELPALIISSPLLEINSNDVIGIRTSQYKYFRDKDNPNNRVYLFNLLDDPLEEKNISKENPKIIQEFETIIAKKQPKLKQNNSEYDEEELKNIEKELKKMGYI